MTFKTSSLHHGAERLFGREREIADLDAAWNALGKKNIITIVAWGGMGKTSLVAHWAAKELALHDHDGIERYFDWSFYSQGTRREGDATGASHAASADLFLKEALEFFGDPVLAASNAGAWQKGERLAQLVGNRRCLLILDGLEPLQDARTGELRDDGLRALLRGLAAHNHGLCLVTTRQHLPDLNTWRQTTAPEWELARLTDEAGAALLTKLGVNGTDSEKRDLSARVKGHALTLTLLGNYLRKAHHGDIRRVDRVDFQKVNEKEQGGHAFRVIAAYERWFEESDSLSAPGGEGRGEVESHLGKTCLAILRMLGLFDRPATPDCLAALRDPPIPGLTDTIATLNEDDWNEAVTHLVELNLVEEQPWEPTRIVGYSEDIARKAMEDRGHNIFSRPLGEAKPFENSHSQILNHHALDAHPLIREFFAKRLQETVGATWKAPHARLFEHLRASVPYWPDGLVGLQPLYQAVAHGCQAGKSEEALTEVYCTRILQGNAHFSWKRLGTIGADLAAISNFFRRPWDELNREISDEGGAFIMHQAGLYLRGLGRLTEAVQPMQTGLDNRIRNEEWQHAAIIAGNLSELRLALGEVAASVRVAEKSVELADRSGKWAQRIMSRTTLADASHQSGRLPEALATFSEAEVMQNQLPPYCPLLCLYANYLYCDALLTRAGYGEWLASTISNSRAPTNAGCRSSLELCHEVQTRVKFSFQVAEKDGTPLEVAVNHLTLGQALLLEAVLQSVDSELRIQPAAIEPLNAAVDELRRASRQDCLPRVLLTRAWLRALQGQPDLARADLDEAHQIAERGPMRLHLADIHLQRARLFRDKDELKRASALIEQCGYWRRKQELEDAEEAAKNW